MTHHYHPKSIIYIRFTFGELYGFGCIMTCPGGGHGNPLQYSCLENAHGQRSLVGYSPWGPKESDTTEWLSTTQHIMTCSGSAGKEPACHCGRCKRRGFNPWVGKTWGRKWQLAPVFLPGKFHGQRSLAAYSPWGCRDSDTTNHTHTHLMTHIHHYSILKNSFTALKILCAPPIHPSHPPNSWKSLSFFIVLLVLPFRYAI